MVQVEYTLSLIHICDGYICPMQAGEYLLLCSDGLVNTVTDQEMLFEVCLLYTSRCV